MLGAGLVYAGVSHLTFARSDFLAQVPGWVPLDADFVVVLSGVVEIALGAALVLLVRHRVPLGWIAAGFFVTVFPGNVSQYVDGDDAFGLDTDTVRAVRLVFQPVLVAWALWCTGAWTAWRTARRATRT
ncbi:MAG: DoxX family protein [Aquihabitans sp.]